MPACPTADDLAAYCLGDLPAERIDAVATHLDECASCASRLSQVARGSDPLADAVRNAGGVKAYAAPPTSLRDYRIEGVIGEGGMGTVYRAVHSRLNRPVALKLLTARRRLDPAAGARFEREMRAIGALKHPHIVQATDAGEVDGVPFLVMELLDGRDLGRLVQEGGPLPVPAACDAIRQAALGLQHAHDHGLVHRDVKPSNLMRTTDGTVKVLDLGLARSAMDEAGVAAATTVVASRHELTDPDTKLGTDRYMAPEQRTRPDAVGPAADVFSLGRTLCFLLTGNPDLPAAGVVPARLHALLGRMQGPTPETRIASAGAVARVLEPWSRGSRPMRQIGLAAGVGTFVSTGVVIALIAMNRGGSNAAIVDDGAPTPAVTAKLPKAGQLGMTADEAASLQQEWASHLCLLPVVAGDSGLRLAVIPPGELNVSEVTHVRITKPFLIGVTEVTVGQFREFVDRTGHRTSAEMFGTGVYQQYVQTAKNAGGSQTRKHRDLTWKAPGYPVTEDCPVTQVSWNDAVAFCEYLSARDGKRYRLPTSAEATWASRAGCDLTSPGGIGNRVEDRPMDTFAVTPHVSPDQPRKVASRKPNAWGLYDTVGNVAEWSADWMGELPGGTLIDPVVPASKRQLRALTGGSYVTSTGYGPFGGMPPEWACSKDGFRVVREP